LAHHVEPIRKAAIQTDQLLYNAIQSQPSPPPSVTTLVAGTVATLRAGGNTSPTLISQPPSLSRTTAREREQSLDSVESSSTVNPSADKGLGQRHRAATVPELHSVGVPPTPSITSFPESSSPLPSRPQSPAERNLNSPGPGTIPPGVASPSVTSEEIDLFDYQATVNSLTIQFLNEHEQTRVAALKWLIMLHQKAPKKVGIQSVHCLRLLKQFRSLPWTTVLSQHC